MSLSGFGGRACAAGLFLSALCSAGNLSGQAGGGFVTISPGVRIVLPANLPAPVVRATEDLRRDLAKVLGGESPVAAKEGFPFSEETALIVAGPETDWPELELSDEVTGREAHAVYVRKIGGMPHVILHGSDMRGMIYAIYTFSEDVLGVPPLWLWASWEPEVSGSLELPADFHRHFPSPQVRWRGWYPNGQTMLSPWRSRSPEHHDAYAETMLRLKLNLLDTLSILDGGFRDPYKLHPNADMAKRYGLVLTTTHTAPLGAHPEETRWKNFWRRVKETDPPPRSIYDLESLRTYWAYHIEAAMHHGLEMIWPIGFRGSGDIPFWEDAYEDPGTDEERAAVIERMLTAQVELLRTLTGEEAPDMRITLYNEKSDFVAAGLLDLPDEPGLVYNFVAARRDHYPPPDLLGFDFEPRHLAGYYFNYSFVSTGSFIAQGEGPWKMEWNFRTADEASPNGLVLAVVNAGNIREHVMELAANAAMMRDFGAYDSDAFLLKFCETYFGEEQAEEIARLYRDFYDGYWVQREPDLDGFARQYLFQDLRLHRAMRILIPLLRSRTPDMNPFWEGDWFRIDPAASGTDNEIAAVMAGMEKAIATLESVVEKADALLPGIDPSKRAFFNDNLRVQAYFLKYASEVVYHLSEAMRALHDGDDLWPPVDRADRAAAAMIAILAETEHGIFDDWYAPDTHFHFHDRKAEIAELLAGIAPAGFNDFSRWQRTHFTAEQLLKEEVGGPLADPDGDGLANLLEYALGGNPGAPDAEVLSRFSGAGAGENRFLTLGFTPPAPLPGDVRYVVETSDDLVGWTADAKQLAAVLDDFRAGGGGGASYSTGDINGQRGGTGWAEGSEWSLSGSGGNRRHIAPGGWLEFSKFNTAHENNLINLAREYPAAADASLEIQIEVELVNLAGIRLLEGGPTRSGADHATDLFAIFDGGGRKGAVGSDVPWYVEAAGGFWHALPGSAGGGNYGEPVRLAPLVEGETYRITVAMLEDERWEVTIRVMNSGEIHKSGPLPFIGENRGVKNWINIRAGYSDTAGSDYEIRLHRIAVVKPFAFADRLAPGEPVLFRDRSPIRDGARRFMRLRIERNSS